MQQGTVDALNVGLGPLNSARLQETIGTATRINMKRARCRGEQKMVRCAADGPARWIERAVRTRCGDGAKTGVTRARGVEKQNKTRSLWTKIDAGLERWLISIWFFVSSSRGTSSVVSNPDVWITRLASAAHCSPDSSIGAMRWSSYDRRPSFAGTDWAGGSFGTGSAGRGGHRFRQNYAA